MVSDPKALGNIPSNEAVRVGIHMPRDLANEFRDGCQKRGYKQSALVRIALEEQFLKAWRKEDAQADTAA